MQTDYRMRKKFVTILVSVLLVCAMPSGSKAADGDLFPYPVPPEDLTMLHQRCNYLVDNFWKRCNFNTAFSSMEKLNNTFGDWTGFLPYATPDTVFMAIDNLLAKVKKSGPQTLKIAHIAEGWLYTDTADFRSEELYLPFARAAASHKKIPSEDRKYFAAQVKIMESSAPGATIPDLRFTKADGSEGRLHEANATSILIVLASDDCMDCRMEAVRLSANPDTDTLIKDGRIQVVYLFVADPKSDIWKERAASLPDNWIKGIMPDAGEYFRLNRFPTYCITDESHKVAVNNIGIDQILNAFNVMCR